MKNSQFLLTTALTLCASLTSAATLTNQSSVSCTANGVVVTGNDSCYIDDGHEWTVAESIAPQAEFGDLHLSTNVIAEGPNRAAHIDAKVGFADRLVVFGAPSVGDTFLEMEVHFSISGPVMKNALYLGNEVRDIDDSLGPNLLHLLVPYQSGQVIDFGASLFYTNSAQSGPCAYCSDSDGDVANFTLRGFRLLQGSGAQLDGFNYHTESGSQYDFIGGTFADPAAVPEPGTLAMAGLGLIAVTCWRGRRD
jgi:hypothetical protein